MSRSRVGIRHYAGGARRHAYFIADLVGLRRRTILQAHPVCHEDSLGYELAHPGDMISPVPFSNLGDGFVACTRCESWLHRHPHEVLVHGAVVVVRDNLEIPEPRWPHGERVAGRAAVAARPALTGPFP